MKWPPLNQGPYTSAQRADAPLDAYLRWADATNFASYLAPGDTKADIAAVPVLIELEASCTAGELKSAAGERLQACRAQSDATGFFSANATPAFFEALYDEPLRGLVRRVEMGMPVIPSRPARPHPSIAPTSSRDDAEERRQSRNSLLIAVIDDGCAFAHQNFRSSDGSTRILALWDQDARPAFGEAPAEGVTPPEFGYGREVSRDQLDAVMKKHSRERNGIVVVDEAACYASVNERAMHRRLVHGPHVLDLIAGPVPPGARTERRRGQPPSWASANDAAVDADIVFVQLPRAALQDTSGGWLTVHVIDALRYVLSCAGKPTQHIVVNLSYGPFTGPHDGSSMLERAMQDLVTQAAKRKVRLDIVLPAGNGFQSRCHAHLELAAAQYSRSTRTLRWRVLPSSETPSFLQIWIPPGADEVTLRVTPPQRADQVSDPIAPGDAVAWPCADAPLCSVIYGRQVVHGKNGTMILLAVSPTSGFGRGAAVAPHGIWLVELTNESSAPVSLDAYIARNDSDLGMQRAGRQSCFVDPKSTAVVRRRGTLNGIATGSGVTVAAGYRWSDKEHARYSSAGPSRGSPSRPPDVSAVSEENPSLHGVRAAGPTSGSAIRLVGTSFAAPQVARELANRPYNTATGPSAGKRGPAGPENGMVNGGTHVPPSGSDVDLMGEVKLDFHDPGGELAPLPDALTSA